SGAGEYGGEVIRSGPATAMVVPESTQHTSRSTQHERVIRIVNAREHNLKNVTAEIPLGCLVAVTGVSGSGKSTLIRNCLYNRYQRDVRGVAGLETGKVDAIIGTDLVNEQVMKVQYKGRNVNDILQMTVDEAARFFVAKRALLKRLDALRSVGLGYLRLGQSTDSLSGGEAQRLKLASFLAESSARNGEKPRLFLFDEPTTGLHHIDIEVLIKTFRDLIAAGNSVVVVEHNVQLIEQADWVIDLGP